MKIEQINIPILASAGSMESSQAENASQSQQAQASQNNLKSRSSGQSSTDSSAAIAQAAIYVSEKTKTKETASNEIQLKSLKNDVREAFRELGIVPPPSLFGGVQLPSDVEFVSFPPDSENSAFQPHQTTPLDVLKLMMVKDMAKRMADRLKDGEDITQQSQDSSSVNAVE